MEEIILLKDYRSTYASKFNANPYRSGLDIELLKSEMINFGFRIIPTFFNEIDFAKPKSYKDVKFLYQSTEAKDPNGEYKSFIDDVLYFLEISGAILIPSYTHFKAHANKVFMEIYRTGFLEDSNKPKTYVFGSLEDFERSNNPFLYPVVIKRSHGAQSIGVSKAESFHELRKIVKSFSQSNAFSIKERLKEEVRKKKYSNYISYSSNRNKFLIQSMIPGLKGDFKILVFYDIFFIVKRENRPNDFRASGGGFNAFAGEFEIPNGIFHYSEKLIQAFKSPFVSLDIGINENGFNLIEFQAISFGTSGHSKSKYYFKRDKDNNFQMFENDLNIEHLYGYSIANFLKLNEQTK